MIIFDRVTYGYNAASPILKDFSLRIDAGEEVAIIGANGCGKTTFGLLLAGILKSQSGTIEINGGSPNSDEKGQAIGFLFQDPDNGLVTTTVEREVAFSLENQNIPSEEMRGRVAEALNFFDLGDLRFRSVWQLSGGEKQRLMLAALFVTEPPILFLDEPASFLDYGDAERLEKALSRLKKARPEVTIIRVTQHPEVAARQRRVVLIDQGKVQRDGPPGEVFSATEYLAAAGLRPPLDYLPAKPANEIEPQLTPADRRRPVLTIRDLTFKYDVNDGPYLIDNFDIDICADEVLAVAGSSGCGKSTLAQIICGLYRPQKGVIESRQPGIRAVMSFQQPERQFFCDTVLDEVASGARLGPDAQGGLHEMAKESLELAGLRFDHFQQRDPHSLSGGEARRLGHAVIVALKADVYIFDEPTCGLDERGVAYFKRLVQGLKKAGKAVVFITHDADLIADLADSVALMKNGKIACHLPVLDFFLSSWPEGILSKPRAIHYQLKNFGRAITTRSDAVFDLSKFMLDTS